MPEKTSAAAPARHKPAARPDRRDGGRHRRHLRLVWRLLGDDAERFAPGHVRDISRAGLAVTLDAPVRPGSVLLVKLEDVSGAYGEPCLVRVRHAAAQANGTWLAGCSFTRRFSEPEFQALLQATTDRAPAPEPARAANGCVEKRTAARKGSESWQAVRIKPVNILRPESVGRLRDYSRGGVGLVSLVAFPAGTLLHVRSEGADAAPWVQVRVRHCRPHERQWVLGCQFADAPTPEQLAQFS